MAVEVVTRATATPVQRWARVLLAGPLVLLCSLLLMGVAHLWVPAGRGGVNHIVLPILLYPAFWTTLFFYACFERRIWRGYAVVAGMIVALVVVVALHTRGFPA